MAIRYKTAEPDDNIKFESSNFPKGVLDTTLKSRENEILKCDLCSKSETKKRENFELFFLKEIKMSCQLYTKNKTQDVRREIAALRQELREARHEQDALLRDLKIRWANFKLDEAIAKLRRMI